jgi:hypothetical protein
MKINHIFVKSISEEIEEGTLYISMEYATAIHKCFCGCGEEVVTPFSPTDWKLTFDGKTITLYPSIGNWSFQCQSHYWIRGGEIKWASQWTREQIEENRDQDRTAKKQLTDTKRTRSLFDILFGWTKK